MSKASDKHLAAPDLPPERAAGGSSGAPELDGESTTVPKPRSSAPRLPLSGVRLRAGDTVDQFRITGVLGKGGMGEVYAARDTILDREVALKIVSGSIILDKSTLDRFRVEARATAKLNNPNIVTIHSVGEFEGRPYVALELLRGCTLRDQLAEEPLRYEEALAIGVAIANALECAHAAGVYHRDLKPANVMLCDDGRFRVLDFGLAKIADSDTSSLGSATGQLAAGTPSYMSPEQWRMEKAGGPSDIWALGVLLFEMCTRQRPYREIEEDRELNHYERILALQQAVGSDEPAPDVEPSDELPPELCDIIGDCLKKTPAERPLAAQIAERLRALLGPVLISASGSFTPSYPARAPSTEPASVPPHPDAERESAPVRRGPPRATMIYALVIIALALALVTYFATR